LLGSTDARNENNASKEEKTSGEFQTGYLLITQYKIT
jgi:hypothetical protein